MLKQPNPCSNHFVNVLSEHEFNIVKPALSCHSKRRPKTGFHYRLSINAGQEYCKMLQDEHSAILSTFIKMPFSIETFVSSIFKWPLKTGFTVMGPDLVLLLKTLGVKITL